MQSTFVIFNTYNLIVETLVSINQCFPILLQLTKPSSNIQDNYLAFYHLNLIIFEVS